MSQKKPAVSVAIDEAEVYLDADEAAQLLHCSKTQIYRMARHNQIPAVRIGRMLRVPRNGLLRLLHGLTPDNTAVA